MPNKKKITIVANLQKKLQKAQAVVLTDYQNLTHQQLEELRKTLKKLGSEFCVVKNSLLKIALASTYQPPKNRKQRTENKEQRTENKEQKTENKEQKTENKEQKTENREQPPATSNQFPSLSGPTAILLTKTSDLSPIKIIHEKGKELESLKIKWGVWQGEIIDQEKVLRLATLPSREVLLAQLLSQIANSKTRLLYTLKGNLQKLVLILKEHSKS